MTSKRLIVSIVSLGLLIGALSSAQSQQNVIPSYLNGVNNSTSRVGISTPLPVMQSGALYKNITTATDTNVKASSGTFVGLSVNTGGAGSSAKIYDDADGTCSSNLVATVSTATTGVNVFYGVSMSTGICVKTAGGSPADLTIIYK